MKWIAVNNCYAVLQEFNLQQYDEVRLSVKFNPVQQSVRINCNGQQRLFFISSAGSLHGKYIFSNEYGVELGWMQYDKHFGKRGNILLESRKYFYTISDQLPTTAIITNDATGRQLISCELPVILRPSGEIAASDPVPFLLLAVCWYLMQPQFQEKRAEFAA